MNANRDAVPLKTACLALAVCLGAAGGASWRDSGVGPTAARAAPTLRSLSAALGEHHTGGHEPTLVTLGLRN